MKNKYNFQFYIVLLLVSCSSILLLGFSFAKESGIIDDQTTSRIVNDNIEITYKNDNKISNNEELYFRLTNKNKENIIYEIKVLDLDNNEVTSATYTLDDKETKNFNGAVISTEELSPYGLEGDTIYHKLVIKSSEDKKYKVEVNKKPENTIKNNIINSKDIYKDEEGNYRYYGMNPNNYIKIDNETYRIVGVIDNRVKCISEVKNLAKHNTVNHEYITLKDYISSYKDDTLTIENSIGKFSWLTLVTDFWLQDVNEYQEAYLASDEDGIKPYRITANIYERYVKYIDSNLLLSKGNGEINNPYEVTYDR